MRACARKGVLARAQYESLDSGVGLTDEELSKAGATERAVGGS
jgi:hypothetical protein